ncbi:MAG: 5'-methylthioadenosine/adenosylhomocysteine nucleosidase [Bdellovibrionales bacterium]|nr:5'-methylthioadenosine/adenosylhomocysteine nucleosidase [Bdellovibrionales bacterium]
MKIGILAALQEEIDALLREMKSDQISEIGKRQYHEGKLWGQDCVLVFSRIGKVAAASTATTLIQNFKVQEVLFTGVAGGVQAGLHPGDVVIGTELFQHDMDASPIFPKYEVPLLGISRFKTDAHLAQKLQTAAENFLKGKAKVVRGNIASGDRFIADTETIRSFRQSHPDLLCVEMEGAAVAQICHEFGIPFSIVRTLSDTADEHAPMSFQKFIEEVASQYSYGIIREYLSDRS